MSPADTALASGFSVLSGFSGEALVLSGPSRLTDVILSGVVDRTPDPKRYNRVNFQERRASVIEIAYNAVDPKPVTGESFLDDYGISHRITEPLPIEGLTQRF